MLEYSLNKSNNLSNDFLTNHRYTKMPTYPCSLGLHPQTLNTLIDICASSAVLSPHVQAVVHSGPLLTVIWWSHSPALRQCKPVHFLWLVQKPGMDFQQI